MKIIATTSGIGPFRPVVRLQDENGRVEDFTQPIEYADEDHAVHEAQETVVMMKQQIANVLRDRSFRL